MDYQTHDISPELNTIFSHIQLSIDLLESEDYNPEHRLYFDIIRKNLDRLKTYITSGNLPESVTS